MRSASWLIGLCFIWLLAGLIGHVPWKGPDAETFALLLQVREDGDWLFPPSQVGSHSLPQLYLWLAQGLGVVLSPLLPLHDAARLASGVFVGITLWLVALTARRLYGANAVWPAVLALMGSMGLLVPAHETNPYVAQLAAVALFAYGLARMLEEPLRGGGLAGLGLAALFLAGAWLPALALALALLLLPVLLPSWRTSLRVGGSWFALTGAFAVYGMWLLSVQAHHPQRLAYWWQHAALGQTVFAMAENARYSPLYFLNALAWFAWPAWLLAGWAVYRLRREGWDSVRLWLPLGIFVVALVALSLYTGSEQIQSIILLPALALLAGAGLGELKRGAANALLWFSLMVFSFFALVFWVYWAAFDLGWPAQLARRLSRLGMQSQGLRPWALGLGLLATFAWIAWLVWLWRQPRAPQRAIVVWTAGVTFVWCLLLALFMRPLDARLGYERVAREIGRHVPAADCVASQDVDPVQRRLFAYHGGLDLRPHVLTDCAWLLVMQKNQTASPGPGWTAQWEGGRPGERSERFILYRRRP
ncbi:MAG: glycosyltransferase family 39 protein [Pseudomonadota bacterium]